MRRRHSSATLTHVSTEHVIGTRAYMPLEALRGGKVGVKVDAYAFGVVLLELLTGRPAADPAADETLPDAMEPVIAALPAGATPAQADAARARTPL